MRVREVVVVCVWGGGVHRTQQVRVGRGGVGVRAPAADQTVSFLISLGFHVIIFLFFRS
jgi:hypothetical protein